MTPDNIVQTANEYRERIARLEIEEYRASKEHARAVDAVVVAARNVAYTNTAPLSYGPTFDDLIRAVDREHSALQRLTDLSVQLAVAEDERYAALERLRGTRRA